MSPARKVRATRRHRQTRRWIVAVSVLLIIVTLLTVAYLWYPKNESNVVNNDPAFNAFTDHYLGIMKNLNSSETKAEMAA
jgi:uncharacterized iron-regulated membrane protein